jgi:DNA helicase IV
LTIEEMLASDGYFYIFYDAFQNLYNTEFQFPITDEPFLLKTNCRNTRQISEVLNSLGNGNLTLKDDAPEGKQVEKINYTTDQEGRKELSRILHKLVNEEGIPIERIVILGGHTIDNTCLKDNHAVGNFTVEREPEDPAKVIRYFTYMRFKGCEADVVILLDVDRNDKRWEDDKALYTAMSRAKFMLYVLYKDESSNPS